MRKKQYLILIFITILLFSFNTAFAEINTFEKEYIYQASDFDSKYSSRTIALETVKRLLLEELGTYLITETEVKNFQFSKDQITAYSAGIVSAEIIDEWDGKSYWLKAKVSADPIEVEKALKKLVEDKNKLKELKDTKKRADELTKENIRLRAELEASAKTQNQGQEEKEKNIKAYDETINGLSAVDWFEKADNAWVAGQHQDALYAINKAIELDPQYAHAYSFRGALYYNLGGNEQQAINDYNKAIELDPQDARGYGNRGVFYDKLGNYKQAIKDYSIAIKLNPQLAKAYYYRGVSYHNLGNYQQAIKDYKIAARLGNKGAQDYLTEKGISW